MQFNSIEFIFCFLPLFLAVYLIFPKKSRSVVLILGSLGYYALSSEGDYWWAGVLAGITVFGFLAGLTLTGHRRGILLGVYLTILAGILIFFKVYDGGRHLPAGMSFYLFQIVAYLIDLYRLRYMPEKNILSFAGEIMMFPKLMSGPLMDPRRLQLENKYAAPSWWNFRDGMQYLILGLGMKVLLANRLGGLWSEAGVVGYAYISVPFAWMALVAYALELYFDFYGYSLMAVGLGKMLGFDLPRNFDAPYVSKTVSEFFRRWHITLGAWFREYLYIPLGGNRKGTWRTLLNLAVVWLFTGLWHGAGGNYLLWAGFLCLLVINEKLWLGKLMKRSHGICHVYVVFVILLSWIPFAIGDWNQMLTFAGRLFGVAGKTINAQDYLVKAANYGGLLAAGVFFATPLPRKIWEKIWHTTLADILLTVLFWVCIYYIATAAQDPFMYFRY